MRQPGSTLRIQERFVSLQGEGIRIGTPSSFVRVSGCNLRCAWCDTPRTSWTPEGERIELDELVRWCGEGSRDVVLTGGEPLLFAEAAELSRRLRAAGHYLTIETAGTVACPGVEADLMSISPKLSHSTPWARAEALGQPALAQRHEQRRIDMTVLRELLSFEWQLKFVVRTSAAAELAADLREVDGLVEQLDIGAALRDRVLLMPEGIEGQVLARGYRDLVEPCRRRGYRLGGRLHIHLFGHTPGT